MTAVAGIIENGVVWMGGDSCTSAGDNCWASMTPKVWTKGPYILGVAGSAEVCEAMYNRIILPPESDKPTELHVAINVRDAIKEQLTDLGMLEPEDTEFAILLGYKGRLFLIDDRWSVDEAMGSYRAIGSAGDLLLGSLYSTEGQPPNERLKKALSASSQWSGKVRPPFVISSL